MAPLGAMSTIFGRVPVLNFCIAAFLIGTIIASAAPNFAALISGRVFQGIGGGGVVVILEIVVTDLVPLKAQGKYFSVLSILWAIGDVGGPLLGGLLSAKTSWVSLADFGSQLHGC